LINIYCHIVAVHFWAPTFKWGISIANIADFAKPPEKISYPQQIGMLVPSCSLTTSMFAQNHNYFLF
jgi:Mitochondrial pyruvate carriers